MLVIHLGIVPRIRLEEVVALTGEHPDAERCRGVVRLDGDDLIVCSDLMMAVSVRPSLLT